jgi:hypothetical protein
VVYCICGLARGHVMSARSDTAYTGYYTGHLLNRPALAELLEAAKLGDLEVGIGNITVVVEKDLNLAVPFKPGYRVNCDLLHPALL